VTNFKKLCGRTGPCADQGQVDDCIQDLVRTLNDNGYETIASCCGHGHRPASIILKDNREILIMPFEEARKLDNLWPDTHGKHKGIDIK